MANKKIRLHGRMFWLIDGAIAPLDHCDERGNLVAWTQRSYAHIYPDGAVMRFGEQIATSADIEFVEQ